jgi:tetratricopeptide (TPR) repeat protein
MAYGALGDAYSEKEEYENALQYYTKAANVSANQLTTPIYLMKAA